MTRHDRQFRSRANTFQQPRCLVDAGKREVGL
jgi:hypothetical protein